VRFEGKNYPKDTDSEGIDSLKPSQLSFYEVLLMNKTKRAARRRRRAKETLKVAESLDRSGIYDQRRRMDVHNKMANLGKGDYLSVTEYYRLERYRTKVMYRDVPTRDDKNRSKYMF